MLAVCGTGGIVIHTTSGVSALIVAHVLGRRLGFDACHGEFRPSNLPMACIGTSLLWAGWCVACGWVCVTVCVYGGLVPPPPV
jgi:ammonia channel protein AmtB